ncbi:reverse transcriptase domain-containing protein [Tanacetum coccineum]
MQTINSTWDVKIPRGGRHAIHPEYPEQTVVIGSTLTEKRRKELCSLLKQNLDIFAWKPADMTGVPRSIAEHCLNIREDCSPVQQRIEGRTERNRNQEEVEKLVDARIMKEVHYHSWLSNPCTKKSDFQWTQEAEAAFKQMKKLIAELPTLTAPREHEELIIYLAATKEAISAVLMMDQEGKQIPCKKTVEKIIPSIHNCRSNRPTNKAIIVKFRNVWENAEMEIYSSNDLDEESSDELMAEPEELPEPWTLFTDDPTKANGLVERANRSLGEGIKAMLDERSKDWIEELPHVLWAHRTMIKLSNRKTPFSLTYGTKAVILAEIGMPTLRTTEIDLTKNNEALGTNLDLIEERREQAAIQEAKSKKKMEKYYNSRVRGTSFKPGDMVQQIWKQFMLGMKANSDPSGKDRTKLKSRWEKEHTNSKTVKEMKYQGHGTFVISKSAIYMKCKNRRYI